MSEDSFILGSSLIICLLLILSLLRHNKRTFVVNFVAFLIYESFLAFMLMNHSDGGTSLVWWAFMCIAAIIHSFAIIIYYLRKLLSNKWNKPLAIFAMMVVAIGFILLFIG